MVWGEGKEGGRASSTISGRSSDFLVIFLVFFEKKEVSR